MNIDDSRTAKIAYDAYRAVTSDDEDPHPHFDEIPDYIKQGWAAAVAAILEDARNLEGDPLARVTRNQR